MTMLMQFPSLALGPDTTRKLTPIEQWLETLTGLDPRTSSVRYAFQKEVGSLDKSRRYHGSVHRQRRQAKLAVDVSLVDFLRESLLVLEAANWPLMTPDIRKRESDRWALAGITPPDQWSDTGESFYRIQGTYRITDEDVARIGAGKVQAGVHSVDVTVPANAAGAAGQLEARIRASLLLWPRCFKLTSQLEEARIELSDAEITSITIS